jgi:hypothetical protein
VHKLSSPKKVSLVCATILFVVSITVLLTQSRSRHLDSALLVKLARVGTDSESIAAQHEIRSIGTNAIPGLIAALKGGFSTPRKHLSAWAMRRPWMVAIRERVALFEPEEELRVGAYEGLRMLGPLAEGAVPALEDCLNDPAAATWAMQILAGTDEHGRLTLGPGIYPSLLRGLTNSSAAVRQISATGLGHAQTNAAVIVPALLRALADTNAHVRAAAAFQLGGPALNAKRDQIIPALIPLLSDGDSEVRRMAAVPLGLYGREASSALETVTRLSKHDPDPTVRVAASESAQRIAGVDLKQAGVSPDTEASVSGK